MKKSWFGDIRENDLIEFFEKDCDINVDYIDYEEDEKLGIIVNIFSSTNSALNSNEFLKLPPKFYCQFGEVIKCSDGYCLVSPAVLTNSTTMSDNLKFLKFMTKKTQDKKINKKTYLEDYFEAIKEYFIKYRNDALEDIIKEYDDKINKAKNFIFTQEELTK